VLVVRIVLAHSTSGGMNAKGADYIGKAECGKSLI
jgi:hypothetical protein